MKAKAASILLAVMLFSLPPQNAEAFWMWTPETNRWVNPKYAAKDTPQEQLQYAKDFYQAGEMERAAGEFYKLIKYYPRAREAAEAQFYIGEIYEKQERYFDAYKAYQVVVEKYPFSERAADIIKRQYDIGNILLEGKEKRSKIVTAVVGGEYDVIEVFRTVIKNAPYGPYAAPSQYKIGLYLQEKQLYQEARDEFEKTLNDYPETEWAKAAEYQIAMADAKRSSNAQYDQKVTEAAIDQFKDFVEKYPDAELSDDARGKISELRDKEAENHFVVGAFYEKQKKYDAAKVYYNTIVTDYKNTQWASRALEKLQKLNKLETKTK